mmetsp:Transcript_21556/g.53484  ORF Transcript_21556/g.53484 Transcript_21556/m.53484 type:complete len:110 (-) Transcript_21556:141-470(-)
MGAPLLLLKLWLAKKVGVLVLIRAVGLKRIYRGGLKLNNRFVTNEYANTTVRSVLHKVAAGALNLNDRVEGPARRLMNSILFGKSAAGPAGPAGPASPPSVRPPPTKPP